MWLSCILPNKTLIWGFDLNDDYVVIAYDEEFQSLGVYFNFSGEKVDEIDFFGSTRGCCHLPQSVWLFPLFCEIKNVTQGARCQ